MICDICARDVRSLAATAAGRRGLNLCRTCYRRILRQEEAERQARLPEPSPFDENPGPPYEWPRCELCGDDVDSHGLGRYTCDGAPRRFCSVECRALRNARVSAPLRALALRERVRRGLWHHPHASLTPQERSEFGSRGGEVRAAQIRAQINDGTWTPPAASPEARQKLSRPRKHAGNPLLHSALEKLSAGARTADLTPEEAEAARRHWRELAAARSEQVREQHRRSYRARMSDPANRARQRQHAAACRKALAARPPNSTLTRARRAAGLSRTALAERLGVHRETVRAWELHSSTPRSPDLRRRVADLLGCWPWPTPPPEAWQRDAAPAGPGE